MPIDQTTQPVAITINDGPAPSRIRSANQYNVGDIIALHYTITAGTANRIECIIQQPDGTRSAAAAAQGTASFQATQAGQHWYAFDAYNTNGDLVATAETIFLVQPQHISR